MSDELKRGARALLELIYPIRAECMGCGARAGFDRDWLCEECRQALKAMCIERARQGALGQH